MLYHVLDVVFDPADDHEPWIAVKVYRDGNPIDLGRFKTREEAEEFIDDLEVMDKVLKS